MQETEFESIDKKIEEEKRNLPQFNFVQKKEERQPEKVEQADEKTQLINTAFNQAVVQTIANNEKLQGKVVETARKFTETKMQVIETDVDTEHKKAVYNNNKDACESYGIEEKTSPLWAVKIMKVGYSIMLAIYLFVASFTIMPVIFLARKFKVALKHSWLAIVVAILLYYGIVVGIPLLKMKI